MINAIIIDDEINALHVLEMQLKSYCPDVNILKLCEGGEEGIASILSLNPDLVFLDIEMPIANGFDVIEATKHRTYKVIFTTAYDQFAIKAFKYSAIDYLLKPIDIEELKFAVDKVSNNDVSDFHKKLDVLYDQLKLNTQSKPKKMSIPFGEGFEMVAFQNIIRCESESNYTIIILNDNRKAILAKTLKDVEESIQDDSFYRVHNSHLINLNYVKRYFKNDGGYVVMADGAHINISRYKKDEFYEILKMV